MSNINIFEVATRNKFRFPYKGMISTEDLWDLSLTALDGIYKVLNKQIKQSQEESLLKTRSKEDEVVAIQIEIVKHIVSVKQNEAAGRLAAKERKERNQRIMEIIENKKDEELKNKSIKELQQMMEEE